MRRRTRSAGTVLRIVALAGAGLTVCAGVSGLQGVSQAAQVSSGGQIQPLGQAELTDLDPVEAPPVETPPVEISPLRIRAIPGITTTTHLAPPSIMIPAGTTVVLECVGVPNGMTLRWVGADEVERSAGTAAARCVLHEPGEYLVKMEVRSGGTWTTLRRCALTAVDIAPEQINILPITASVAPLDVDESSSNETTMLYYYGWFSFGESIARLRDRGDGHFSTSIQRDVTFAVQTDPPGFEPLVEWNVHGHSRLDDLGSSITRRYNQVGSFALSAGAALNGPVAHLETYSVTITSHVSNRDIAPDGQPVTFAAVTDPPGYEDDITWLSSTKYGTGTPVLGSGPIFTVQFDDTWGPDGFQWLGVRADNTRFNQDQKPCDPPPDCNDGNLCTDDSCDPATGGCVNTDNTAPCDDGDACTTADTCGAGACAGGPPPNCDDGNVCTDDSCNPAMGGCVNTDNTAPCDDGDACTTADTCGAGACAGGPPPNCDDGNVCTDDSCNPETGCVNAPICTGACCGLSGGCFVTTEAGCVGSYQGDGTTCDPDPCLGDGGNDDQEPPNDSDPDDATTGNSDPVYLFSGEYYIEKVDLRIPGRGFDFVWSRKYRSREGQQTEQGVNWDYSYNIRVEADGADRVVFDGNSRRDTYSPAGGNCWTSAGFFQTLCLQPDGTYVMTFADMRTWTFAPLDGAAEQGKIIAIQDRNGNAMTFDYDAQGRLVTIHDTLDTPTHDRDITIAYNTDGFVESVTDWAGRQVTYTYYQDSDPNGSLGDLESVTYPVVENTPDFPIPPGHEFPLGKTWTYTYTEDMPHEQLNHNISTITDAKGQTYLNIIYSSTTDPAARSFDRVAGLSYGGGSFEYVYVALTPSGDNNFATTKTIVNDRAGNVEELFYDSANQLGIRREYTGRADPSRLTTDTFNRPTAPLRPTAPAFFERRYEYNSDSLLTRKTFPNQNVLERTYDSSNPDIRARGNLLEQRHLPGPLGGDQAQIFETYTYHTVYNFVTTQTDGRGNTTTHAYDPANGDRLRTDHRTVTVGVLGGGTQTIVNLYEYNSFGQMTGHTNPTGRINEYIYYASGSSMGYLHRDIVDAPNFALTTAYEYDRVGNVTKRTDPRNHDTQFLVNQLNQVVRAISREVTDGSGLRYTTETFYDANDNVIRRDIENIDDQGVSQPNTHFTTTYEYDILDNRTRMTQEVEPGHDVVTEYEYDANFNRTLVRYGEASNGTQPTNVLLTLYDERDLVFQKTRAQGNPGQSTTQYDYDGNKNVAAIRQGLEDTPRVTTHAYDGYDRLVSTTDPMGNLRTYHYDANGNRASERLDGELIDGEPGPNVRLSEASYFYDQMDRLFKADLAFFDTPSGAPIDDGFSTTKTFYNAFAQVIRVEDDNGHTNNTSYDTANRPLTTTDAKGNTRTLVYDANSNILTTTEVDKSDLGNPDETFVTTFTYDNLDRLIRTVDNDANTIDYGYDSRSNRTVLTDAIRPTNPTDPGNVTRYEYDGLNRITQTTRFLNDDGTGTGAPAGSIVTTQTWDDSSRLTGQADDNGNTSSYAYDPLNRKVSKTHADGTIHSYEYDVHHNRTRIEDANGSVTLTTYDLLDRQVQKNITPGPGVSNDTTFDIYKYDGLSRIVHAEDDDSIVVRAYDSLSNVLTETLTISVGAIQTVGTVTATYDGVGNMLTCIYPGGRMITCTYDELDRKSTISDQVGSIASYDYIGPGRVEQRDFGNNTRYTPGYDNVRRMTSTTHVHDPGGASTTVDARTYTWDRMFNKTSRTDTQAGVVHTYAYDSIYRMGQSARSAPAQNIAYNFDGVGNRTTVTGGPNPGSYTMDATLPEPADFQLNQYTTTPPEERTYDKNGDLTGLNTPGGSPALAAIAYDYRNQMVEYMDITAGQRHTYAYDCFNRRIAKITDADGSPTETRFHYSNWRVCEEQDVAGATLATYAYGNGIDEVLTMRRGTTDHYYHADDLGNVMNLTDATGAVAESYDYGDYGQPLDATTFTPITGSTIGNPYLFTGRRYDSETGWYYYRTRYLDPVVGRFTTRDTIGIWGDLGNVGNGYAYVGNAPWTAADPYGRGFWENVGSFLKGAVRVISEPYHQIQDVTKLIGAKIMDIPEEHLELKSIVGQTQQQRIGEGQSVLEASVKGVAEIAANTLTGGGWGVGRAEVELYNAYVEGRLTFDQYKAALWEVAGGQTIATAMASVISRTEGTAGTWTGRHPKGFYRASKSWNKYQKATKGEFTGKGNRAKAAEAWRQQIKSEAWSKLPTSPTVTPGSGSADNSAPGYDVVKRKDKK